ncbi:serine/arginine repetitive matrix protein 2 [Streptomyces profundus]|uniref:serine/arginine repetitive matrix protein 2 n=1 Tax=Streptomyces profundus TaxID=2867410 RepID=UPI001D167F70|nr:serine/arginine repetitive matrix protein 2 [Streptomyces sp. MA3_2.13]UED86238.1 serine/arginine repetitive matrix protein 2 [Streptomyces sp. MA3_2.13]
MADFAMDYDKLYAMKRGLHDLADRADSAGGADAWQEIGDGTASSNQSIFGNYNLSYQFQVFYGLSKTRINDGKDKLKQFGDMFGGVADVLLEQDAGIAAGAMTMTGYSELDKWLGEREAYSDWEEKKETWDDYAEEIGAGDYFAEHPDADPAEVCSVDDPPGWCEQWQKDLGDGRPPWPGPEPDKPPEHPPNRVQITDEDGSSVDVYLTYDDEYNVTEEKTVIETSDGRTVTTTVEYEGPPDPSGPADDDDTFDRRDYTVTTIGPDGTESVAEYTIEDDGSGTQKVTTTTTDDDGDEEVTVTEYTRDPKSGPDDKKWESDWEEVED